MHLGITRGRIYRKGRESLIYVLNLLSTGEEANMVNSLLQLIFLNSNKLPNTLSHLLLYYIINYFTYVSVTRLASSVATRTTEQRLG
jgi:hypothetical protein